MFSGRKCVDLPRHEKLLGFPRSPKMLEEKKAYFVKRSEESEDEIEANNFKRLAKLVSVAMEAGADRAIVRTDHKDPKQPALYICFDFKGLDDIMEFEHLILKTNFDC